MRLNSTRYALAFAISALFLAACGGNNATPTPIADSPAVDAPAVVEGALPREHAVSAADLQMGDGTDFCSDYPQPEMQIFAPDQNDPLFVKDTDHVLGAGAGSPVTLVIYGALNDPQTTALITSLRAIIESNPDSVRVVFRHFANEADSVPMLAAQAAEEVAAQQGNEAFWQMVHLLTENQGEWASLSPDQLPDALAGYAETAGADPDAVLQSLEDEEHKALIQFSSSEATTLGAAGPLLMYANDIAINSPPTEFKDLDLLTQVLILHQTYVEPPPMVIDVAKDYAAWIVTEKGTIAIDLYADLAPETVNNFAYLSCIGYYDGVTFHRVLPGFMAQAGDPTGTGVGGPAYTIVDEFYNSGLRFDREGLLSMAHTSQPNSAGSQFFITYGPASHLDGAFTIFGEVVSGMDAVQSIAPRDPEQNPTTPGDSIETIVVRQVQ